MSWLGRNTVQKIVEGCCIHTTVQLDGSFTLVANNALSYFVSCDSFNLCLAVGTAVCG